MFAGARPLNAKLWHKNENASAVAAIRVAS
jgi:hypothetical protein